MMEFAALVALGVSLFGAILIGGWLLDRSIKREADALHERATEQEKRLAVTSAELQFARSELGRARTEIQVIRAELDRFIHGPPSLRPRSHQAS